jgi:hypothetical protein
VYVPLSPASHDPPAGWPCTGRPPAARRRSPRWPRS